MSNPTRTAVATLTERLALWPIGGEEAFRRLLEHLPVGAYVCNADGLITYYNPHAVQIWGRVPRLLHPDDRYCGALRLYAPDGSPTTHDDCGTALALREQRAYLGREAVIEQPEGERVTVLTFTGPIHDATGRLLGAVTVLVDISDRKRVEEARRGRESAMREEARLVATLQRIGQALTSELDLRRLVQAVTDAGTELTDAECGVLFYDVEDETGSITRLHAFAGPLGAALDEAIRDLTRLPPSSVPSEWCGSTMSRRTPAVIRWACSAHPRNRSRYEACSRCRWSPARGESWAGSSSVTRARARSRKSTSDSRRAWPAGPQSPSTTHASTTPSDARTPPPSRRVEPRATSSPS